MVKGQGSKLNEERWLDEWLGEKIYKELHDRDGGDHSTLRESSELRNHSSGLV